MSEKDKRAMDLCHLAGIAMDDKSRRYMVSLIDRCADALSDATLEELAIECSAWCDRNPKANRSVARYGNWVRQHHKFGQRALAPTPPTAPRREERHFDDITEKIRRSDPHQYAILMQRRAADTPANRLRAAMNTLADQ